MTPDLRFFVGYVDRDPGDEDPGVPRGRVAVLNGTWFAGTEREGRFVNDCAHCAIRDARRNGHA